MSRLALAAAMVVAASGPARADDKTDATPLPPYKPGKPDRWAVHGAEEANLEDTGIRSGFAFVGGVGPALQVGVGLPESVHATGTGGSFSFRLGRFANRDTLITLEICGTIFPQRYIVEDPDGSGPLMREEHTKFNQSALATFGVQTYVAPTFWVRFAAGLAVFTSRDQGMARKDVDNKIGGGAVAGAGIELIRRRSVSLAIELMTAGAIYRDGLILGGGLGLSLGIY